MRRTMNEELYDAELRVCKNLYKCIVLCAIQQVNGVVGDICAESIVARGPAIGYVLHLRNVEVIPHEAGFCVYRAQDRNN